MMRWGIVALILLIVGCQALGQSNTGNKPLPESPTPSPVILPTTPPPATQSLSGSTDGRPTSPSPREDGNNSWLSGELISGVIGAIVGALFGAGASQFLATRHARKQIKFETLRRFVANRFDVKGPEFTQVLNEIMIVYADSSEVTTALNDLLKGSNSEKLVSLYRAMCRNIGIKNVSDELFLTAFNITNRW
jgi:hypothetical protein